MNSPEKSGPGPDRVAVAVGTVSGDSYPRSLRSMVIGAGKMGYVYAIDAKTGRLIWKTPVGEHNRHDNDSLHALEHQAR